MKLTRPHTTHDQMQAFYACAVMCLCWLAGMIGAVGAPEPNRRLKRFVRRQERFLECFIFLQALNRVRPRTRKSHVRATPGFRRVESSFRLMVKGARVRLRGASLRDRVLRLMDVLLNPEPYIVRFAAKLRKGLRRFRLIAAAPTAVALNTAPACELACADSS